MRTQSTAARSIGTAIVTGASAGIGATYASRLAARGFDLILVARNEARLARLGSELRTSSGRSVELIRADLRHPDDVARVEDVFRARDDIVMLVNNAGVGAPTPLLENTVERLRDMIELNVSATVQLTHAAVAAFSARGAGTIVNIASIVALAPELLNSVYGGTKAFVLAFSRALQAEFGAKGIHVQVVLPGATATDFWPGSGTALAHVPRDILMTVDDLVDAAIRGLERKETVTIPSLPDFADWEAFEAMRRNLIPKLSRSSPAPRYADAASSLGSLASSTLAHER